MSWDVRVLLEVESWLLDLDDDSYDQVSAAIDKLAEDGPTLGRPLVDRISGSRLHNMKDFVPAPRVRAKCGSCSYSIRGVAPLLVAGDKAGNWSSWYRNAIPMAERRYDAWLIGDPE